MEAIRKLTGYKIYKANFVSEYQQQTFESQIM